ncbi:MAG: adenylosuccinate synthase [Oscillospiraceae bacterium]|nr:adenylosuccinate synthase [Christensenellales bacterium]
MANCAIVGINWGDEGKGRMVDLLASEYDVVVRYQGGNNAGHTVINQYGKFALHLIPSGIFRPEVINLLGNGTVIDPEALLEEMQSLQAAGVSITPENFKISDRATIVFPYHRAQDALEEERLKDAKYGSTKRGIAPVYSDKFQKKTIMMGELMDMDYLGQRLKGILEWKNLTIQNVYGAEPYDYDTLMAWLEKFGGQLRPYICDAGSVLRLAQLRGKNILFEAQLGALRDIDYGIYPYTSSSTPLAAYAPIGCGAPDLRVDEVLGIVKAYSTCVGEGPFTAEWFGAEADKLREAGGEYGAATGRPRRVGPLDLVATRYGVKVQGATSIALTKLDILSYMEEIPVCIAYDIDGKKTEAFPFPSQLAKAKPVMETLPGWGCDISGVRYWEDLPQAAQDYVTYVEDQIGCPITYVSVGADRDAIIQR